MQKISGVIKKTREHFLSDSLYRNSIFMMASTFFMSGTGFIFWIACARLFSSHDVGLATSALSVVTLLSSFSMLGYNNGLIRYFHLAPKGHLRTSTCLTVVTVASLIASAVFLIGLGFFSPKLLFIRENILFAALFLGTIIATSVSAILDSVLIANKKAELILIKTVLQNTSKCLFPFLLSSLGAFGIFTANSFALFIALALSIWLLQSKLQIRVKLAYDKTLDTEMRSFALANYSAGFIEKTSSSILPLIVVNTLGTSSAGYFYINLMIMNALYIIPTSMSQIMFAEGSSDDRSLKTTLLKSLKFVLPMMALAILLIIAFGRIILGFFGPEYAANGYTALVYLCLAGIPVAIKVLANVIMNIERQVRFIILTNVATATLVIGLGFLLTSQGLKGIALGWIIGEVVGATLSVFLLYRYSEAFSKKVASH